MEKIYTKLKITQLRGGIMQCHVISVLALAFILLVAVSAKSSVYESSETGRWSDRKRSGSSSSSSSSSSEEGSTLIYEDPTSWPEDYPTCGGSSQSPINIDSIEAFTCFSNAGPLLYEGYQTVIGGTKWTFSNTGETVKMSVRGPEHAISGGGLPGRYLLDSFHFHWGKKDKRGSEHTIDDEDFPMEMHLVHYNDKFASLTEAQDKEDGLAVIGFVFKIRKNDNRNYDLLIKALQEDIKFKGDSVELLPFPLAWLLPDDLSRYFRYRGSLTTPSCFESVVWTVMNDPIPISSIQMEAFRSQFFNKPPEELVPMVDNFRPVQKQNGRKVTASFLSDIPSWKLPKDWEPFGY